MKKGIHPDYHPVLFHDVREDIYLLISSTMSSKETKAWEDGNTYPLVHLDVTSHSHPFFNGKQRQVDSEGRSAKFTRRYGRIGSTKK